MGIKSDFKKQNLYRVLANALTLSRGVLAIPLIYLLSSNKLSSAWLLLSICCLTDLIDGWFSRQAGGGTEWGARFDPLCDKILISAPLIWLVSENLLPIWAVWIFIAREIIISEWRSLQPEGGSASFQGKAKTFLLFTSVLLMIWPVTWGGVSLQIIMYKTGWLIFWPTLLIALSSAIKYINQR